MKAVRVLEYGGQLVFDDIPTPTIARDEVLVKIRSTAVNHLDLVKASGTARQILPIALPWIAGHEFSGVVEQTGSDVAAYAPGDAVFGVSGMGGAYAEYLAVKPAAIATKPSTLSFEEAASAPVAAQTAWQGIFTHGHLEKGHTILIHGGAGAVGAYAVQLASHAGATVIAAARGDDEAYLNSIGASRVYRLSRGAVREGSAREGRYGLQRDQGALCGLPHRSVRRSAVPPFTTTDHHG
jgi:NADPH:quinone reductase-like Zn-dependent oxidoreductase